MESNKIQKTNIENSGNGLTLNTVESIIDAKLPSISVLRKNDHNQALKFVADLLIDLNSSMNLKEKMNPKQILSCAEDILTDFYSLTLPDIQLALKRIKTGRVKILERLDQSKIFPVLDDYLNEKTNVIGKRSLEKHNESKKIGMLSTDSPLFQIVKQVAEEKGIKTPSMDDEEYRKFKADYYKSKQEESNEGNV